MAGVRGSLVVDDKALTASSTKTIIQAVATTNHPIKITGLSLSFIGTSNTDAPRRVELVRQDGAGTSSALVPIETTISGVTLQTTGRQGFSAEPSTNTLVWATNVHPQSGFIYDFPFGEEIQVGSGGRLGLRVITPSGTSPNCTASLFFEE